MSTREKSNPPGCACWQVPAEAWRVLFIGVYRDTLAFSESIVIIRVVFALADGWLKMVPQP